MDESMFSKDPKQFLFSMMSNFSEKMWSAGWFLGFEFILWKNIRECSDGLSLREIADFNLYAGLAGGWWCWDESQKCATFICLQEWLKIYRDHQLLEKG